MKKFEIEEEKDGFFQVKLRFTENELIKIVVYKGLAGDWLWNYTMWLNKGFYFRIKDNNFVPKHSRSKYPIEVTEKGNRGIY